MTASQTTARLTVSLPPWSRKTRKQEMSLYGGWDKRSYSWANILFLNFLGRRKSLSNIFQIGIVHVNANWFNGVQFSAAKRQNDFLVSCMVKLYCQKMKNNSLTINLIQTMRMMIVLLSFLIRKLLLEQLNWILLNTLVPSKRPNSFLMLHSGAQRHRVETIYLHSS